jgi:hypothetical protein
LATNTITSGRYRVGLQLLGFLLLSCTLGCSQGRYSYSDGLAERIVPPLNLDIPEPAAPNAKTTVHEVDSENARPQVSAPGSGARCETAQILTLPEAIDTAFRQQPRLRVYLESAEQAQRGEDIAFAPFLPMVVAGGSVGGFDVNAGGLGVQVGQPAAFTFLPALGAVPIGLKYQHRL